MSDEINETGDGEESVSEESLRDDPAGSEEATRAESADPEVTASDEPTEATEAPAPRALPNLSRINATVVGLVTLHFPERDVAFECDGAAAMRIVALVAGQPRRELEDELVVTEARSWHGWIAFRVRRPLAVSWVPSLGVESEFAVVDPIAPSDAEIARGLDALIDVANAGEQPY